MKTQDEIAAHIGSQRMHEAAVLFGFLDQEHRAKIYGRRLAKQLAEMNDLGETPLTPDAIGTLLARGCQSARNRIAAHPGEVDPWEAARRESLRGLVWVLGDEDEIEWEGSLEDVLDAIEKRYGLGDSCRT